MYYVISPYRNTHKAFFVLLQAETSVSLTLDIHLSASVSLIPGVKVEKFMPQLFEARCLMFDCGRKGSP